MFRPIRWHLRPIRVALDWTQADLAARAGLSAIVIHRIEAAGDQPTTDGHELPVLVGLYRAIWQAGPLPLDGADAPARRLRLSDLILVDGLHPDADTPFTPPPQNASPVPRLDGVWWNIRQVRAQIGATGQIAPSVPVLASQLGVSAAHWYGVQNGKLNGSVGFLVAVARLLQTWLPQITLRDLLIIDPALPAPRGAAGDGSED